jgi:molybdopterin-guanine dinucleotide biosynthesis protein A
MAQNGKNIAGIILDLPQHEGNSGPSALQKINNISFLESVAIPLKDSNCSPLVIITTEENPIAAEAERLGISPSFDDSRKKGEIPAMKKALTGLDGLLGALVVPVTYPQISRNVYLLLCHVFMENPDRIIIPIHMARRGFPVALPNSVLDYIRGDSNILYFDDLLRANSSLIFEQLVNDPGISKQIRSDNDRPNP